MKRAFGLIFLVLCFQASAFSAESDIGAAEKAFLEGKYERAVYEADKLIDSSARHRDELYYLKGLSELKLCNFDKARESFNYILNRYQRSRRTFDAYIGIGDSYLLEDRASQALSYYKEALNKYPNDPNTELAYSRITECDKKLGINSSLRPAGEKGPSVETKIAGGGYSIQVGSFKSKANADKLSDKLSKKGYESRVEIPINTGDKLYRVKVGRLGSKEEASGMASRLKRSGYSTRICADEICQ